MRVIILPGNGCMNVHESNWYGWLQQRLISDPNPPGFTPDNVLLRNMPDPHRARRSKWLPFIQEELLQHNNEQIASQTIVVGHSSGAQAAMRLAQGIKLAGLVLVSACHTDLGSTSEAASGWYPPNGGPWEWDEIYKNSGTREGGNIILLHSLDDPFIPIEEPRFVMECLMKAGRREGNSELTVELREFQDKSHFFYPDEEIAKAVYDVANRATMEQDA